VIGLNNKGHAPSLLEINKNNVYYYKDTKREFQHIL